MPKRLSLRSFHSPDDFECPAMRSVQREDSSNIRRTDATRKRPRAFPTSYILRYFYSDKNSPLPPPPPHYAHTSHTTLSHWECREQRSGKSLFLLFPPELLHPSKKSGECVEFGPQPSLLLPCSHNVFRHVCNWL